MGPLVSYRFFCMNEFRMSSSLGKSTPLVLSVPAVEQRLPAVVKEFLMSSIPGKNTRRPLTLSQVAGVLAAALVLSVPVVAVKALITTTGNPTVSVAPADDPVSAGFQVVYAPGEPVVVAETDSATADAAVLVENWTETGGGGGNGKGGGGGSGSPGK
jgi:hypothetical protein